MALSIPPNKLLIFGALALAGVWYARRVQAQQQAAAPRPAASSSTASHVNTLLSFLGAFPGENAVASGVPAWDAAFGRAAASTGSGQWVGENVLSGISAWDDAYQRAAAAIERARVAEPEDYGQFF